MLKRGGQFSIINVARNRISGKVMSLKIMKVRWDLFGMCGAPKRCRRHNIRGNIIVERCSNISMSGGYINYLGSGFGRRIKKFSSSGGVRYCKNGCRNVGDSSSSIKRVIVIGVIGGNRQRKRICVRNR